MNSTSPISAVVADALTDAGLNHKQVEVATGISRATLARKLADESRFTLGEIERIARILGITPEELVGRRGVAA